jgi:hypothetical protein
VDPVLLENEIAEERSLEHLDIKVAAPGGGFVKVTHAYRTTPMPVWRIQTREFTLECAGKHLVKRYDGFTQVDQILPGDWVLTENDWQMVASCEPIGEERELFDLRVDSEDHAYFTSGIASHNSTGLCGAELLKFCVFPNYRAIYLTPLKEQSKTIADKMLDMQRGSVCPPSYFASRGYRNNMYYKEAPSGGSLKLMHILTDPSKIRGNSVPSVLIDEAQDFDSEHLPEIEQVQKAFPDDRLTIFAGTSKDLDTCLEAQYRLGSRGVWHIPCSCPKKFHSLGDPEIIPNMMVSPEGLRCPDNKHIRLNPMAGEFVHEDRSRLNVNMPSFHLPQVIVPEYAQGKRFMDIWQYYQRYTQNGQFKKFLQEIWGIAVESGMTELSEADLKKCCTDKTFARTQSDYFEDKVRYIKVFSGVDWGGSDWEPAYRSKLSYTVHVIYGMTPEGRMDLLYAHRYAGMNYREVAQHIVANHNKYQAFAMGTDNGGGAYYNAYMRDCGAIPTNLLIHFQYTDTKLMLDRIPHPESNIMSLHRSDSISAVLADIKDGNITWPRWDDSSSFALDCLNVRRNITEAPSGRTIMRYIKHGARADDFLMATNYACMMKRIVCRESLIPNKQIMEELRTMFGISIPNDMAARMGDMFEGGYVGG